MYPAESRQMTIGQVSVNLYMNESNFISSSYLQLYMWESVTDITKDMLNRSQEKIHGWPNNSIEMTKLLGYDQYLINIRTKHSGKSLTNQRVGKWNGCIKSWYSIASIYGAVISMNKLSIVRRKSYIGRVWGVTKRLLYA